MTDLVRDLQTRFSGMETFRTYFEPLWELVAKYLSPQRFNITGDSQPGEQTGKGVYDDIGIWALNTAADSLFGYLTNPMEKWYRSVIPGPSGIMDIWDVGMWCQQVDEAFRWLFNDSNFYDEIGKLYHNGLGFNTVIMLELEDQNSGDIDFNVIHPGQTYIDENHRRRVDTFFRPFTLTARQAVQEFSFEKLSRSIQIAVKSAPSTEFEFLHCIFPRTDRDLDVPTSINKPFASIHIERGGGLDSQVLKEGGFDGFPGVCWRPYVNPGEKYGRGPGIDAITSVVKTMRIGKDVCNVSNMAAEPPLGVHSDLEGKVRITPRGQTIMDSYDKIPREIFGRGFQYPIALDREEAFRGAVKRAFYIDFFLAQSAYVSNKRERMLQDEFYGMKAEQSIGLARLLNGFSRQTLDGIFDRSYELLVKQGRIPPPPPILWQLGIKKLSLEYLGPLAQLQKFVFESQGIQSAVAASVPLWQVDPESKDPIDLTKAVRRIWQSHGAPMEVIRRPEEMQAIVEGRAQAQQQIQQQAQMAQGMETMRTMAEADKASGGQISAGMDQMMGAQ